MPNAGDIEIVTSMRWLDVKAYKQALADERIELKGEEFLLDGARFGITKESGIDPLEGYDVKAAGDVVEEDGFTLPFKFSDATVDRDNDTLSPKGWVLKNFKKNPVILWAHNRGENTPPIGRASNVRIENDALKGDVEFVPQDLFPFGNMIGRMVRQGFIRANSVGFIPLKGEVSDREPTGFFPGMDFTKQELLENSVVPIGSNPAALQGAKSAGIDLAPMVEWCEKQLDGHGYLIVPRDQLEQAYFESKGVTQIQVSPGLPSDAVDPDPVVVEDTVEPAPIDELAVEPALQEVEVTPASGTKTVDAKGISLQTAVERVDKVIGDEFRAMRDLIRAASED